jgi:4-hydroxy-tetrahydrodipicolinate synthase
MEQIELKGTIVPIVTPFNDDESLNLPALEQLINYILCQGADGLIPTALTGEGPQLKDDEISAVWDVVFQKAKQKVSVVPAVISHTTARAVHLLSIAEEKGAAAVMVAPILNEFYVERSQSDIIGFYKDIAGSTSLWPPRFPFFGGVHALTASRLNQIVISPRFRRDFSYSGQFLTW